MADTPIDPNAPTIALPDVDAINATKDAMGGLHVVINGVSHALNLSGTAAQVAGAAFLGAGTGISAFTQGMDTGKVNTFGNNISVLEKIASDKSIGFGKLTDIISKLGPVLVKAGGNAGDIGKVMGEVIKGTSGAISVFFNMARSITNAADEQLKLQGATVQQMAAQGNLSTLYNKAGLDLSKLNGITAKQVDVLNNATQATGLTQEQLGPYMAKLSQIPGYQQSIIDSLEKHSAAQQFFTRTIQFSIGAGRDYTSMMNDIRKATMEYGVSQEQGLEYTARMSESAELLHIPVSELQTALNQSADAFKMFATSGDAAASSLSGIQGSMTGYIKMLTDSGVPIQNAIELGDNLSKTLAGMTTANKAFLSTQAGGPGGLMGAAQINLMLKQGKTEEVFRMQQKAMEKQLGPIVSTEEAARSENAAARQQRQILMLRGGPLGGQATTDAQAIKILDAMKQGKMATDLLSGENKKGNFTLENAIKAGNKIHEKSHSALEDIRVAVQQLQTASSVGALNASQRITASAGYRGAGTGIGSPELQQRLLERQRAGAAPSGENAMTIAIKNMKDLPKTLTLTAEAFSNSLKSGTVAQHRATFESMNREVENYRASIKNMATDQQASALKNANAMSKAMNQTVQDMGKPTKSVIETKAFAPSDDYLTTAEMPTSEFVGPAAQVRQGIPAPQIATGGAPAIPALMGVGNKPIPVILVGDNLMKLDITSVCPHCGNTNTSGHSESLTGKTK